MDTFTVKGREHTIKVFDFKSEMAPGRFWMLFGYEQVNLQIATMIPQTIKVISGARNRCEPQEFFVKGT
jgi:hypothetical protein